jgi:hypothetical protein
VVWRRTHDRRDLQAGALGARIGAAGPTKQDAENQFVCNLLVTAQRYA